MNEKSSYRAVIFGTNPIASGTEVDLPYVDGKVQEDLVREETEGDVTVRRRYRRGHPTEEPVPYHFVDEVATGEPRVPN